MPGANRHRQPNNYQLFARIYRRQIASDKAIAALASEVSRLAARTDINVTLADHCRRLLREKATLLQIVEANQFMAAALPRRTA